MRSRSRGTAWLLGGGILVVAAMPPAAAQGPILVRYPYLQNVSSDRATILWGAREPGVSAVQYAAAGTAWTTVTASQSRVPDTLTGLSFGYYRYQVDLTGLRPGVEYVYRVVHEGRILAGEDALRFRTAGPGPFRFLVFGDSGTGSLEQRSLAQLILRERPALVLHTGDLAYTRGTFLQMLTRYLDIYQDLFKRAPVFPTPGNHEYETESAAPYLALHAPPTDGVPLPDRGRYYSFDWGDAHFVSLDTNLPLARAVQGSGAMLQWLDQDLTRSRRPWRMALLHHAPYPTSIHENDATSALVRAHIVPILERHNVQLVFSGHEHNYQHSKPLRGGQPVESGPATVYVISGGGGAALYPVVPRPPLAYAESAHHYIRVDVEGPRLTLQAVRIDSQEIDRFTLTLPPPPAPPAPPPVSPPVTTNPVTVEAVVNAASFTPGLASGSLISIFGRALASTEARAARLPLPHQLSSTTVTLNGRSLPLLYVSSTQINAKLRYDVEGPAILRVTTSQGSAEASLMIQETAPAVFRVGRSPAVARLDGTLVTVGAPAVAGETLCVYLTGLGRPEGPLPPSGAAAPAAPLLVARGPIRVIIGDRSVTPLFAGLTPGFAGLYQVNFTVPEGLPSGTVSFHVVAREAPSDTLSLAVQAPDPTR